MAGFIPKKYKRGQFKQSYKTAARIGTKVKKRYVKDNHISIDKIAKDLLFMKSLMNVEKKRIDTSANALIVGQCNANLTGSQCLDITPIVVQGNGYNQRSGSSLKLTSAYIRMQYWTQVNNNHKTRVKLDFYKVSGIPVSTGTFISEMYLPNTASGIIDYNSNQDPDFVGTAKKFYSKEIIVGAPNFSGEVMISDVTIPWKLQHHVRYDMNTTTVDDGQIIMVVRADSGNSGLVSTLANIPVLTASSGLIFNIDFKYYYVDN